MVRNIGLGLSLLAGILCVSGCDAFDPYGRDDVWKATGANSANIAAMVANPQDLLSGRGSATTSTKTPQLAVDRVWSDTPKQLLMEQGGGSSSSGSGSGSGNGSGGGSSGGGGSPGS
ncbi:MAG TPA: hypothetical protein VGG99_25185 [Acetobacteraceae bacterium]|jgi:uncharacterized membrane protein YgcG